MNEAFKPNPDQAGVLDAVPRTSPPPGARSPSPEIRPRTRNKWVGRALALVVLLAAGTFVWEKVESPSPQPGKGGRGARDAGPQTIRVGAATLGEMPITLNELGTVTPFGTVTIRTQIAGILQKAEFTEGQTVKRGDPIAQIDPRPYQAALSQSQGQLAKDQALLAQAQSDLARYQALSKQDSISKQQVDDQDALVSQDKAAIMTDTAQVQTAQLNLGYTHIVSPIDGRAGLRLVDPGNYLQPSDTAGIVVITEMDPISVVFTTPEDNLPQISARLNSGAKLKVTVLDRANVNKLATGTLTTYDSQVDVTTGTIRMRAAFANPNSVLFPNQFVNVQLLVDTLSGVVLAPNAAIQIGPSGDFVYLLNADSTVSKRDVSTGPTDGAMTTITKGLAAGDQVVIDGVDRLRDGSKVKIAEATPGDEAKSNDAKGDGAKSDDGKSNASGEHRHHRHGAAGEDAAPTTGAKPDDSSAERPAQAGAASQPSAPAGSQPPR